MWDDLRLIQSTSKGRRWRGHLTKVPPGCLLGQVFLGGGPGKDPGRLCCDGDLIIGKGWMDGQGRQTGGKGGGVHERMNENT